MKKQFLAAPIIAAAIVLLTACQKTEEPVVKSSSSPTETAKILSEPEITDSEFPGTMSQFETKTLYDEPINQDVFKDYDLTMVNIWATWCGPCVSEIPDLADLYEQLPAGVNMITFCTDADSETELAKEIVESANSGFQVLMPSDSLSESLLMYITGFPSTIFVDSSGNPVGELHLGVPMGDDVVAEYLNLIDERLNMAKGESKE